MRYYRNRHYWGHQESNRATVSRLVAGIDEDIVAHLFQFTDFRLQVFFRQYAKLYGEPAAKYAAENLHAWKNHAKAYTGPTLKKFIQVVPKVLSFDEKFELFKKLYVASRRPEIHTFEVVLGDDSVAVRALADTLNRLCERPSESSLEPSMVSLMSWVSDNDMSQAKQLLSALETERSLAVSAAAIGDVGKLMKAVQAIDRNAVGVHEFTLPYGKVTVRVRHPSTFESVKRFFK
jgi:hypothetical protein